MDGSKPDERIKVEHNCRYTYRMGVEILKTSVALIIFIIKFIFSGFGYFNNVPKKDISGQTALITGGANGLGKAISIEFAKAGCNIAIVDIDEISAIELAKYLIDTYGIKVKSYKVDVSIYKEIQDLKEEIERDLGYVDILVNNAGLLPTARTLNLKLSSERISKLIDVNVKAHIWTVRVFLDGMKERKQGHIVSTCSISGLLASPHSLDYQASKGAVRSFMDGLYFDLVVSGDSKNIKTTTLFPGLIMTNDDAVRLMKDIGAIRLLKPMKPSFVARAAMDAVLKEKRYIIVPWSYRFFRLLKILPDKVAEQFIKSAMDVNISGFDLE